MCKLHNHPLDKWTQDDYHGLAAIFAKVEGEQVVKVKPSGEIIHPVTREKVIPEFPAIDFYLLMLLMVELNLLTG